MKLPKNCQFNQSKHVVENFTMNPPAVYELDTVKFKEFELYKVRLLQEEVDLIRYAADNSHVAYDTGIGQRQAINTPKSTFMGTVGEYTVMKFLSSLPEYQNVIVPEIEHYLQHNTPSPYGLCDVQAEKDGRTLQYEVKTIDETYPRSMILEQNLNDYLNANREGVFFVLWEDSVNTATIYGYVDLDYVRTTYPAREFFMYKSFFQPFAYTVNNVICQTIKPANVIVETWFIPPMIQQYVFTPVAQSQK